MLKLKNIKITDAYIEADYIPECSSECGHIKMNRVTKEIDVRSVIGLHSNISDVEYENKEQILNYLKKETFIFVRLDILRDIFTGDTISYENRVLGDNEYVWSDELIYYVEKYNAKLPNEFVNHILKSY